MVFTKDLNVYINALAVHRDATINSREMNPFPRPHKSTRLRLNYPTNVDDFAAAMNYGQLLPRTVAEEVVWRFLDPIKCTKAHPLTGSQLGHSARVDISVSLTPPVLRQSQALQNLA